MGERKKLSDTKWMVKMHTKQYRNQYRGNRFHIVEKPMKTVSYQQQVSPTLESNGSIATLATQKQLLTI